MPAGAIEKKEPSSTHREGGHCECVLCRDNLPFTLPDELVDACIAKDLVIFAGAGVSTESRRVIPYTFYEQIAEELPAKDANGDFPDVMEAFCKRFGRAALLRKIRNRFNYVRSFPELYGQATRFHDCLSTMYPIVDLVTTNWDTAFEDRCGATAIVTPTDYAFWDEPARKVFKLHGSIASWGSIVATRKDYDQVLEQLRTGVIGGSLRHLLATKKVLFAGYSFSDSDFQEIYGLLRDELGDILPESFVVTLDPEFSDTNTPDATIIRTDATHLLSTLKNDLVAKEIMQPDDIFPAAMAMRMRLSREHMELATLNVQEYPAVIYSLSYQDGLMHALDRTLALRHTGEYSHICNIFDAETGYESRQKEKRKQRDYGDVAYLEGYLNGLRLLLVDEEDRELVPLYFVFGFEGEITSLKEFLEVLPHAEELHKTSYRKACRKVKGYSSDIVFHHSPFL